MNRKFYSICFALLFSSVCCFAQKKKMKVQYRPIPMANVEEAFPVAAMILNDTYQIDISRLDWGAKEMLSQNYEYRKIFGGYRFKFFLTIDTENTLNVEAKEMQTTDDGKEWKDHYVGKTEREIVAEFTEQLSEGLKKPDVIKKAQELFYTNLSINALFFSTATEVAGNRWFDNFIKDRKVNWKLTFVDLAENKNTRYKFKYVENYTLAVEFVSGKETKFTIRKYTNSDKNVLTRKGNAVIVEGTCLDLNYNNSFNIVLVD